MSTTEHVAQTDHIVPLRIYFLIAGALFVLLAMTVGVAMIDLGKWNVVAALTIAVLKGVLVVLYFMHVRYGPRLTWVFAGGGFIWFAILIMLTMSDFLSR
jgi:cytochrome c oxidase subunit IV